MMISDIMESEYNQRYKYTNNYPGIPNSDKYPSDAYPSYDGYTHSVASYRQAPSTVSYPPSDTDCGFSLDGTISPQGSIKVVTATNHVPSTCRSSSIETYRTRQQQQQQQHQQLTMMTAETILNGSNNRPMTLITSDRNCISLAESGKTGLNSVHHFPLYQEMTQDDGSSPYKRIFHWDMKYNAALCLIIIFVILGIAIILLVSILGTMSYGQMNLELTPSDIGLPERKDPCESINCPFLQFCSVDSSGVPLCSCKSCPNVKHEIICGSDNQTYYSECDIERQSCLTNHGITVKHRGPCIQVDRSIVDPCAYAVCNYGAVCIPPSDDSLQPFPSSTSSSSSTTNSDDLCQCPYCEESGSQICGSDGVTYNSLCSLKTASCSEKRSIHARYEGHCHTCSEITCTHYAVCEIDLETSKPNCICPKVCIRDDSPVCANNGKTFESECELRMVSCHHQINLTIAHHGPCVPSLCKNVNCKFDAECVQGQCVCNINCDDEPAEPVCADDGVTYANQCQLRRSSCLKERKLVSLFFGTCQEMTSLMGESNNPLITQNPSDDENKVVNSDNNYDNDNNDNNNNDNNNDNNPDDPMHSEVTKASSQIFENVLLENVFHGKQNTSSSTSLLANSDNNSNEKSSSNEDHVNLSCDNLSCLFGAACQYNITGHPYCQCSFHCDAEPNYASYSSSFPYSDSPSSPLPSPLSPSLSSFSSSSASASEMDRKLIFVSSLHQSICGSDGQFYDNECQMKRESCNLQKDISVVDDKFCDDSELSSEKDADNSLKETASEINDPKECEKSQYGCCLDGISIALGPNYLGCPERCFCNRRGSLGSTCDPVTRQCFCKPGIGGIKCNRCEADFWGLHMAKGLDGCRSCDCNKYGSVRSDCEQTTGKCVCIPGIKGIKCDICPHGTILGPHGCTHGSVAFPRNGSCHDIQCFHGAVCVQNGNIAQCICDIHCSTNSTNADNSVEYKIVCGSDMNTYQSECQMHRASCLHQTDIFVKHQGPC